MATHQEFGAHTDASVVASAFSSQIAGKTILITGVNPDGIGGSTAEALAAHSPRLLILSGRSSAKVDAVIKKLQLLYPKVNYRFLQIDLSSQASVRRAADEVLEYVDTPEVDILINNAGVMAIPNKQLSEDGIEMHFATNHLGHFLLTMRIIGKLIASAKKSAPGATRIVNVSSTGHTVSPVRFSDLNFDKTMDQLPECEHPDCALIESFTGEAVEGTYNPLVSYGQSKTANVLFSLSLTRRLYAEYGIVSFALHPGSIPTELARHVVLDEEKLATMRKRFLGPNFVLKTIEQGASTTLVATLDLQLSPAKGSGDGLYLADCQLAPARAWARDAEAANRLWVLSEKLVGEKF